MIGKSITSCLPQPSGPYKRSFISHVHTSSQVALIGTCLRWRTAPNPTPPRPPPTGRIQWNPPQLGCPHHFLRPAYFPPPCLTSPKPPEQKNPTPSGKSDFAQLLICCRCAVLYQTDCWRGSVLPTNDQLGPLWSLASSAVGAEGAGFFSNPTTVCVGECKYAAKQQTARGGTHRQQNKFPPQKTHCYSTVFQSVWPVKICSVFSQSKYW